MKEKRIIQYISKHLRVSPGELSEKLDIPYRTLMDTLGELVSKGSITKIGKPPKVIYMPGEADTLNYTLKRKLFEVSKKQQIKELTNRVPPVLNVGVIVYKDYKFLIGRRSKKTFPMDEGLYGFPGGREYFEESPQEAAERILADEVPGINANLRRMVTALYDKGYDQRAYNVTIYYLFDYIDGEPKPSHQWEAFSWMNKKEIIDSEYMHPIEKQVLVDLDREIRLINSNQDEILIEVDEEDNKIGKIVKRIAHIDGKRFHRAAHIVIFNSSGEVVLHKRSLNKDTAPGKWDIFGGHQLYGQSIKQTAIHELFEELGVETKLNFHSKNLYQSQTQSEFGYLYWGIHDGPYSWDPNEVEEVDTFSIRKILDGRYKSYEFNSLVKISLEKLKSVWQKF